jgi:hypothetical protein
MLLRGLPSLFSSLTVPYMVKKKSRESKFPSLMKYLREFGSARLKGNRIFSTVRYVYLAMHISVTISLNFVNYFPEYLQCSPQQNTYLKGLGQNL